MLHPSSTSYITLVEEGCILLKKDVTCYLVEEGCKTYLVEEGCKMYLVEEGCILLKRDVRCYLEVTCVGWPGYWGEGVSEGESDGFVS